MFTKKKVFLSCLAAGAFIAAAANAQEAEVLRAEDEVLLEGIAVSDDAPESASVQPVTQREPADNYLASYPAEDIAPVKAGHSGASAQREWFNPAELPTNMKKAEEQKPDMLKKEYRQAINDCMDNIKERLYMERELFESGIKDGIAHLSQSMTEINLCYEALGREIIEKFYGNDRTMLRDFSRKTETFYVSGTDVNFSPEFCGENCSMSNILDAQMKKFGDFRIYLYQMLDNLPEGR